MTTAAQFEDINLDMDLDEEIKHVMGLEEAEEAEDSGEEKASEDKAEDTSESTKEEKASEQDTKAEEPVVNQQEQLLQELREERARLQQQLNEISVSALADRRRLESIEKTMITPREQPKQEVVDEGPTPEQIVAVLDQKIAQTDAALIKAEQEDPASAPALRQQLRQLERYYNNYVSNLTLSQIHVPDPDTIVQQTIKESNTQNQFQTVRQNILREFPILDTQSEYFNEALRDQVHEIYNPMLNNGKDPTEALVKATMLVARAHGIKSLSELQQEFDAAQAAQQEAAKKVETASASEKEQAEKKLVATQRKVEQVEKNLKAAEATPPNIANIGSGSEQHGMLDKYDFQKMGIKEFSRLSDAELEQIEGALMMYND